MKILIIGGTIFLGRYITETAISRGHTVTLFNRGQHNPGLFPDVEKIHGDRTTDIQRLGERDWDLVIDTCGYVPSVVTKSAEYLSDRVKNYLFISTISVYSDLSKPGITEDFPVGRLLTETDEQITGETYGPLKVLCENVVKKNFPESFCIVRPGLIVGPGDPTHRFTYWPKRVAEGGEVLAPGDPRLPVQFIDVRDLAEFIIELGETHAVGTFNATGPKEELSMRGMLDEMKEATGSDAKFTWVDEELLFRYNVIPFSMLPLWLPADAANMNRVDISKAVRAGLKIRPLRETVLDTLAWVQEFDEQNFGFPNMTLHREQEKELLEKWKNR